MAAVAADVGIKCKHANLWKNCRSNQRKAKENKNYNKKTCR